LGGMASWSLYVSFRLRWGFDVKCFLRNQRERMDSETDATMSDLPLTA
jgi:hypothetical protein